MKKIEVKDNYKNEELEIYIDNNLIRRIDISPLPTIEDWCKVCLNDKMTKEETVWYFIDSEIDNIQEIDHTLKNWDYSQLQKQLYPLCRDVIETCYDKLIEF